MPDETVEIVKDLRPIYLSDPVVKFLVARPITAAVVAHVFSFWALLLSNALNGSARFMSSCNLDYPFPSNPIDVLVLPILIPVGFWAMGHYHRSMFEGVHNLIAEGVISNRTADCLVVWSDDNLHHRICDLVHFLALLGTGNGSPKS